MGRVENVSTEVEACLGKCPMVVILIF